jgi:hypothetical protein
MNTVAQNIPTKTQQKTELAKHIKKYFLKSSKFLTNPPTKFFAEKVGTPSLSDAYV